MDVPMGLKRVCVVVGLAMALDACTAPASMRTPEDAAGSDDSAGSNEPPAVLTVSRSGDGAAMGRVLAQGAELTCTDTCIATVPRGTTVVLMANTAAGAVFTGWQGGGCENTTRCALTVTRDVTVDARFDLATFVVAVGLSGDGSGTVTTTQGDLSCPGVCTLTLPYNTAVMLDAHPGISSTFQGWEGVCAGTGTCSFLVTENVTATAMFLANKALTVELAGNGGGLVTSDLDGIQCGMDCSASYAPGTTVTLSASTAGDSVFTGWSGGECSGTGACTVVIRDSVSVTASFALKRFSLTINRTGDGNGTVISDPPGVACDTGCVGIYDAHTVVMVTASPGADSLFTGWIDGPCSGSGPCVITMDAATTVGASFGLKQFGLTVTRAGAGRGTVTSDVAGITCGPDCTESYPSGTAVTLTAVADGDSAFTGWSGGGCSGTGTCTVVIGGATSIVANFVPMRFTLTVTTTGRDGSGVVVSTPAGILCGTDCSESYDSGTSVTLDASAGPGSVFTGWSGGACSGTGSCTVVIGGATSIVANFEPVKFTLTVTNTGHGGSGVVVSTPVGILCGTDCSESYDQGTSVTLDASAGPGSVFTGWSGGGCSGTGSCTVVIGGTTSIVANFEPAKFTLTVTNTGQDGSGIVVSTPVGILCGTDCSESYDPGTTVTLNASAGPGSVFTGWSGGGCSGAGPCSVRMTSAVSVTASFSHHAIVYVTSNQPPEVLMFETTAGEGSAPIGKITGTDTTFQRLGGITVTRNEIFVVDELANAVDVFPVTALNNVAPTRRIRGPATALSRPSGVMVLNGEVFVAQQSGSVVVFPVTASGNVSPVRSITGFGSARHLAASADELYVTDSIGSRVMVLPVSATGPAVPLRTIAGANTFLSGPAGIAISNGHMFISDLSNKILVFPQFGNGNITPTNLVLGPDSRLAFPTQLSIRGGEIFVSCNLDNSVTIFRDTLGTMPIRRIVGPGTLVSAPGGVFVF